MKPVVCDLFGLWPLWFVTSLVCDLLQKIRVYLRPLVSESLSCLQLHQRDISPLNVSQWNNCLRPKEVKLSDISQRNQRSEKSPETENRFVLHLMTPQIYLVILWRGPTPRLGTTGLNWLTVYKGLQTSSTCSSSNSNMLLSHWCFSMNNLIMSHRIRYQSQAELLLLILILHEAEYLPGFT